MTYTKPEIVALTHAVEAIHGTGKLILLFFDYIDPLRLYGSLSAYEADE